MFKPPAKGARKSQRIGGTNRRTDFSTKQLPTDLDRGSRPQTHLPFGCCAIRVTWKLKVPLNVRKINSPLGLCMVLEQLHIWHSQYPRGECNSAAVECCGLKGGRGGRGTNKDCPCAAVESKIAAQFSLEIAKQRHRAACREQNCHRRTRCAIPLPRLHCAQTVQALPPCITGYLFCPILWGWATNPSCGEQLCCVPGGGEGAVQSWFCLCLIPPPLYNDTTHTKVQASHPSPCKNRHCIQLKHCMGIYQFAHHWGCTPVCMQCPSRQTMVSHRC